MFSLKNSNGEKLEIRPVRYTEEEATAYTKSFQIYNVDTDEVVQEYQFTGQDDKFIIGSLNSEAYIEIVSDNYYSYREASVDFNLYKLRNESFGSCKIEYNYGGTSWYESKLIIYLKGLSYNYNSVVDCRQDYISTGYSNSESLPTGLRINRFYHNGYYDQNGTYYKFSDLGLNTSVPLLFKIEIRNSDEELLGTDYYYRYNISGLYDYLKIQNPSGSYIYYDIFGTPINESQFPSMEVSYIVTLYV